MNLSTYFLIKLVQSYFRETNLPSLLCTLLFFKPNIQPNEGVPQEFALQFWNDVKSTNAGLILEAIGLLLGSKGAGVRNNYVLSLDASYGCIFLCSSERATLSRDCSSKWLLRRMPRPSSKSRYDYGFFPRIHFPSYYAHFFSVSASFLPLLPPSYPT